MWLVGKQNSFNTLAYLKKPSILNCFLFPVVKEERECICLLRDPSNFGGELLKKQAAVTMPC